MASLSFCLCHGLYTLHTKCTGARKQSRSQGCTDKLNSSTWLGLALSSTKDKKLIGQVKRTDRISKKAEHEALKVHKWLQPSSAGYLESEGAEKTWQFQQSAIVQVCIQQKCLLLVANCMWIYTSHSMLFAIELQPRCQCMAMHGRAPWSLSCQ
jgi:hypothetical protein